VSSTFSKGEPVETFSQIVDTCCVVSLQTELCLALDPVLHENLEFKPIENVSEEFRKVLPTIQVLNLITSNRALFLHLQKDNNSSVLLGTDFIDFDMPNLELLCQVYTFHNVIMLNCLPLENVKVHAMALNLFKTNAKKTKANNFRPTIIYCPEHMFELFRTLLLCMKVDITRYNQFETKEQYDYSKKNHQYFTTVLF